MEDRLLLFFELNVFLKTIKLFSMKHFVFILFFILLITNNVISQVDLTKDSTRFKTAVIQDDRIDKLDKTYTSLYELEGYRIQIYSGNKKQPARQIRLKFSQLYRDVKAHESYQQPYFKVRVGDFRTKLEALKFQKEIQRHFPNCYIVKDQIEIEELLKQKKE